MIPNWSAMLPLKLKSLRTALALLGALLLVAARAADTPPVERNYSLSDATSEVLAKYKTSMEANGGKNYDASIAILDGQIAKAEAGSYDLALLYQIKAQTLLQKGDFSKSIEPLERGLALSDAKTPTYFEERVVRDLVYFLAQLYFQEAVQSKNASLVPGYWEQAEKYMVRWTQAVKKPTADNYLFYTQLLYSRAVQNADHPDLELVKRALVQIDKALHLVSRPKDNMYVLKLVCLQQLNRNAEAAEILEVLVKQKPDSSTYWQQLAALYLSTEQNVRAILTYERAQANGHMNGPKDNYNLIGIYFNLGQYEKSAELLEKGLKNGGLENEMKNWELLAFSYQQLERPLKGIEALKEASKAYPKSGQIEFMIAQAYFGLDQAEAALPHAQAAVQKGSLNKPHQAYMFLAYIGYQLKKFDLALEAAKKAAEFPEGAKEAKSMVHAIEDIIKEREAKKNKT